jgi:anthranilate synthase component 1
MAWPRPRRQADFSDAKRIEGTPVEALRAFVNSARAETEEDLPPMASGAFGYVGYDMIQHVEPVTITKPAALNVPEALLVIPKVVIVFDHIYQELLLIGRIENGNDDEINRQLDEIEQTAPVAARPASSRSSRQSRSN